MSDVKRMVVDIVMGREPQPPKNLIEVKENQFVATVPKTHTKESAMAILVSLGTHHPDGTLTANYGGPAHDKIVVHPEPSSDPTGFSDEALAQSEVIEAEKIGKPYVKFRLVGGCLGGEPIVPRGVEKASDYLDYLDAIGMPSFPRIVLPQ